MWCAAREYTYERKRWIGDNRVSSHGDRWWHSLDRTGLHGTAQVDDAPAGGSVVHAEVVVPAGFADDRQVRDLLAETMVHLQRDVSDNFNAG